jgi:hypothetical protein
VTLNHQLVQDRAVRLLKARVYELDDERVATDDAEVQWALRAAMAQLLREQAAMPGYARFARFLTNLADEFETGMSAADRRELRGEKK